MNERSSKGAISCRRQMTRSAWYALKLVNTHVGWVVGQLSR